MGRWCTKSDVSRQRQSHGPLHNDDQMNSTPTEADERDRNTLSLTIQAAAELAARAAQAARPRLGPIPLS